ncbi:MAG: hypothetical protein VYA84_21695 [Planctomycetota bacterium]|nr:hypothetical protein [Planctomycetota bacterium]
MDDSSGDPGDGWTGCPAMPQACLRKDRKPARREILAKRRWSTAIEI